MGPHLKTVCNEQVNTQVPGIGIVFFFFLLFFLVSGIAGGGEENMGWNIFLFIKDYINIMKSSF